MPWKSIQLIGILMFAAAIAQGQVATGEPYELPLTLTVLDKITVSAKADGFVETINTRPGDPILQEQLLVKFDAKQIQLQLTSERSRFCAAQTQAKNQSRLQTSHVQEQTAEENLRKLEQVVAVHHQHVPKLEMVRAQAAVSRASAEKSGAKQELNQLAFVAKAQQDQVKLLELQLEATTIMSPFEGVVSMRYKNVGEFARKGDPVAEVTRMDKLQGVLLVDSKRLIPRHSIGKVVKIHFDTMAEMEDPPAEVEVVITRYLPKLDADGRYRAFAEVPNQRDSTGQWLMIPGMVASAKLETQTTAKP